MDASRSHISSLWHGARSCDRRLVLAAGGAYLLAMAVAIVGASRLWQSVTASYGSPIRPPDLAPPAAKTAPGKTMRQEDYQPIWQREVRKPYEAPAKAADPAAAAEKLKVKVVGTIVEPPNNFAIFVDDKGARSLKGVGDALGDVKVKSIDETGVTVEWKGQEYLLKVERQ